MDVEPVLVQNGFETNGEVGADVLSKISSQLQSGNKMNKLLKTQCTVLLTIDVFTLRLYFKFDKLEELNLNLEQEVCGKNSLVSLLGSNVFANN